jgi:hypothetical protein
VSINFPNNPFPNQRFTDPISDNTYIWNGEGWIGFSAGGLSRDSIWARGPVGIHTLTSVGIGTILPNYSLHVIGDTNIDGTLIADQIYTVGVVTALCYYGDARCLSNLPVGLQSRAVVSYTINNIEHLDIENFTFNGFKSYALIKIETTSSAWVRIYSDSNSRDNDVTSRSLNEDPVPGNGVIAEVVTRQFPFQQTFTPYSMGGSSENPPSTTIYAAVKNLCGITTDLTVSLTILQLEV